jgi:hypothetical protein
MLIFSELLKQRSVYLKRFIISLSFIFLFSGTGCASGKIHERNYLRAAVISGTDSSSVAMAFFDTDDTVSAQGDDMDSARHNAELKNGRNVFTGYTELLIVDGTDCRRLLEHMLNDWKVSPSCMVVCSDDGEKLLDEHSAEQLRGIAEQVVKKGIAPECDIITVLGDLCTEGSAEVAELRSDGTVSARDIF